MWVVACVGRCGGEEVCVWVCVGGEGGACVLVLGVAWGVGVGVQGMCVIELAQAVSRRCGLPPPSSPWLPQLSTWGQALPTHTCSCQLLWLWPPHTTSQWGCFRCGCSHRGTAWLALPLAAPAPPAPAVPFQVAGSRGKWQWQPWGCPPSTTHPAMPEEAAARQLLNQCTELQLKLPTGWKVAGS